MILTLLPISLLPFLIGLLSPYRSAVLTLFPVPFLPLAFFFSASCLTWWCCIYTWCCLYLCCGNMCLCMYLGYGCLLYRWTQCVHASASPFSSQGLSQWNGLIIIDKHRWNKKWKLWVRQLRWIWEAAKLQGMGLLSIHSWHNITQSAVWSWTWRLDCSYSG